MCIHVEGDVAALATQALVNPMYAVHAMPRLREAKRRTRCWHRLVTPDAGADQRQFHILDAAGRIAQHTGAHCVTWAGACARRRRVRRRQHACRAARSCSVRSKPYLAATGPLAERLLAAMEAGEAAGGDKRGKQSAALKICTRDPYPDLDIRADDHPDPLFELRRLYRVSQERFAVFRRFLPGTDSPCGVLDRAVIDAAIARDRLPPA